MLREATVHLHRFRIDLTEERHRVPLPLDVHTRITKVGSTTHFGYVAVHDNGGHTIAVFEVQSGTFAVTEGHVSIGSVSSFMFYSLSLLSTIPANW